MKTLLLLCSAALALVAQPVSVGVKAGVPISDALDTFHGNQSSYVTNTHRYLIGGTVQLNFPGRFSVEVDGIYKRLGFQFDQFAGPGSPTNTRTVANSWEFPILAKWAIIPGPVRPFVDAGASFRHITGVEQIRNTANAVGVSVDPVPEFHKATDAGFVFGGGVELKMGWVRFTPEFRYTRWGSENFEDPLGALLHTNKNQGDFILGLTF